MSQRADFKVTFHQLAETAPFGLPSRIYLIPNRFDVWIGYKKTEEKNSGECLFRFCVPSMVVSLNQRRRGGYLTATIQIPSWLPSCAQYTIGTPRKESAAAQKQRKVSIPQPPNFGFHRQFCGLRRFSTVWRLTISLNECQPLSCSSVSVQPRPCAAR